MLNALALSLIRIPLARSILCSRHTMLLQSGECRYRLIQVNAHLENLMRTHTLMLSFCQWLTSISAVSLKNFACTPSVKSEDLRHQKTLSFLHNHVFSICTPLLTQLSTSTSLLKAQYDPSMPSQFSKCLQCNVVTSVVNVLHWKEEVVMKL